MDAVGNEKVLKEERVNSTDSETVEEKERLSCKCNVLFLVLQALLNFPSSLAVYVGVSVRILKE